MQKLTYIQKDDGTYEGQVVDMQNHCPTFKQIKGGLLINQLIDYIEENEDFDLYDDVVEELNEKLPEESQYDDSLSYMRDKIFPALDRMCPLNGVKLGTLIEKMINKTQEDSDAEEPTVIESLTQKEIDGLNKTCFSLKVTELGTIINTLIREINGEIPRFIYLEEDSTEIDPSDIVETEDDPDKEGALKSITFNIIIDGSSDNWYIFSLNGYPSTAEIGTYTITTTNEKITLRQSQEEDPNSLEVIMDSSIGVGESADVTITLDDFPEISKTITIKYDPIV